MSHVKAVECQLRQEDEFIASGEMEGNVKEVAVTSLKHCHCQTKEPMETTETLVNTHDSMIET